jgi:hypothetical protein
LGQEVEEAAVDQPFRRREQQPQFARCLVEKLLTYLLGRELSAADRPAIRGILDEAAAGGYRLRDLVLLVCASDLVARK